VRALFVGGTGNIGAAAARLLVSRGVDLTVLSRRGSAVGRSLRADVRDPAAIAEALGGRRFDVVVDWLAFTPAHIEAALELYLDVSQYVFISSVVVYAKPARFPVVETAPLTSTGWPYARDKVACEERLHRADGFPFTIVRPSYTYGETRIPTAVDGVDYTIVERLRRSKKLVVPGDGTALWTMTHSDDFAVGLAGLLGNPAAVGETFHVTSDEVLTWNELTESVASLAGFEPELVHVPSDFIAGLDPCLGAELLEDRAHSLIFDNSKVKRLVPEFTSTVPFAEGIARSLAWFRADPARQVFSEERIDVLDRVVAAYESRSALVQANGLEND
jgi:nucleoside-diphosphate-sugar epimerase